MRISTIKVWIPGLLFLAIQVINTIYQLRKGTKTLTWAPHTVQVKYTIQAYMHGHELTPEEIFIRYGIPAQGWEAHDKKNLQNLIKHIESKNLEPLDSTFLNYKINEHPENRFVWKP